MYSGLRPYRDRDLRSRKLGVDSCLHPDETSACTLYGVGISALRKIEFLLSINSLAGDHPIIYASAARKHSTGIFLNWGPAIPLYAGLVASSPALMQRIADWRRDLSFRGTPRGWARWGASLSRCLTMCVGSAASKRQHQVGTEQSLPVIALSRMFEAGRGAEAPSPFAKPPYEKPRHRCRGKSDVQASTMASADP